MTDASQGLSASVKHAHERLDRHSSSIHDLQLNEAGMKVWQKNTTEKLNDIHSSFRWYSRAIIGVFLAAAVTFVVSGGLLNGTP